MRPVTPCRWLVVCHFPVDLPFAAWDLAWLYLHTYTSPNNILSWFVQRFNLSCGNEAALIQAKIAIIHLLNYLFIYLFAIDSISMLLTQMISVALQFELNHVRSELVAEPLIRAFDTRINWFKFQTENILNLSSHGCSNSSEQHMNEHTYVCAITYRDATSVEIEIINWVLYVNVCAYSILSYIFLYLFVIRF